MMEIVYSESVKNIEDLIVEYENEIGEKFNGKRHNLKLVQIAKRTPDKFFFKKIDRALVDYYNVISLCGQEIIILKESDCKIDLIKEILKDNDFSITSKLFEINAIIKKTLDDSDKDSDSDDSDKDDESDDNSCDNDCKDDDSYDNNDSCNNSIHDNDCNNSNNCDNIIHDDTDNNCNVNDDCDNDSCNNECDNDSCNNECDDDICDDNQNERISDLSETNDEMLKGVSFLDQKYINIINEGRIKLNELSKTNNDKINNDEINNDEIKQNETNEDEYADLPDLVNM